MSSWVVYNEKTKESVTVEANSYGNAMWKARREMGWTHYGTKKCDSDATFRYYKIIREETDAAE